MSPEKKLYFCKICVQLDALGIIGHASNRCIASNGETNGSASNQGISRVVSESVAAGVQAGIDVDGSDCGDTGRVGVVKKQRWDRAAYNAFQRDYMKKRRAEKILKISGEKS